MPIKTTLEAIVRAVQSGALKHVASLVPPGRYGFRVAKLVDTIEREYQGYTKQHAALVRQYGVAQVDAEGKPTGSISLVGASLENLAAFQKGHDELTATEVTLACDPIVFAKLGEKGEAELTIGDIVALGPLLLEDDGGPTLTAVP